MILLTFKKISRKFWLSLNSYYHVQSMCPQNPNLIRNIKFKWLLLPRSENAWRSIIAIQSFLAAFNRFSLYMCFTLYRCHSPSNIFAPFCFLRSSDLDHHMMAASGLGVGIGGGGDGVGVGVLGGVTNTANGMQHLGTIMGLTYSAFQQLMAAPNQASSDGGGMGGLTTSLPAAHILNPIDRLYSMQNAYFRCDDEAKFHNQMGNWKRAHTKYVWWVAIALCNICIELLLLRLCK